MAAIPYTVLTTNLGKQFRHRNALNGMTLYSFLYAGASIAAGTLDATSLLAAIEASWTGYARQAVVIPDADANGVYSITGESWTVPAGITNGDADVYGRGLASASSGGIAIMLAEHMRVCETTSTDATVTLASGSTTGLYAGMTVLGVGIPAVTTIASVTDGTHFELSQAATATTNPINLAFSVDMSQAGAQFTVPTVDGFEANPWEL